MHDQLEPTEEEQEQAPERLEEEQAKSGAGHEDPQRAEEGDDS
jgi:hypothetical protein